MTSWSGRRPSKHKAQHPMRLLTQLLRTQAIPSALPRARLGLLSGLLLFGCGGSADCASDEPFDMTTDGTFGNWEETWGGEVAVSDPNSIQNTSVRPYSMKNGACR